MRRLTYFLCTSLLLFMACSRQNKTKDNLAAIESAPTVNIPVSGILTKVEMGKNILSIFQDKDRQYWFGTNGEGVFRYDGKTLVQYTVNEGLCDNQVKSIQEDKSGSIWLGTAGGICRFDGQRFISMATKESSVAAGKLEKGPDDLWIFAGDGAYYYDGKTLTYLLLSDKQADKSKVVRPFVDPLSPYSVYCSFTDKKGNLWLGTQTMGVCRYDGRAFTWLTAEGLGGPAVRGLFEDKNGVMWFGNNGYGLFSYDPVSAKLTNLTKEKGLGNAHFLSNSKLAGKAAPGTLARVWTISEDNKGVLWIGTIDAGVWSYDGKEFKNYTLEDGLCSNAISTIYKDNAGELWFGTDGAGVCKFNGVRFEKVVFN